MQSANASETVLKTQFRSRTSSMNKSEFVQALTLWFVVMIFMQTTSGSNGPVKMTIGIFSLILMWAIPLYLLGGVLTVLLDR